MELSCPQDRSLLERAQEIGSLKGLQLQLCKPQKLGLPRCGQEEEARRRAEIVDELTI